MAKNGEKNGGKFKKLKRVETRIMARKKQKEKTNKKWRKIEKNGGKSKNQRKIGVKTAKVKKLTKTALN